MSWDDSISDSQTRLIAKLAEERQPALTAKGQWPDDIENVQQWMLSEIVWGAGQSAHTLDRRGASAVLDMLFGIKVEQTTPDGYIGPEADRIIPNRYANRCALCSGGTVEVESGFASLVSGKWVTTHRDGDCDQVPAATGIDLDALRPFLTRTGHGNETANFAHPIHADGPTDDKDDTRQRLRVVWNERNQWTTIYNGNIYAGDKASAGEKVGTQRPGSGEYHGGMVELVRAIVSDPAAALRSYGHLTGECAICKKSLTSDGTNTNGWNSVAEGIGETCAKKVGLR